VASLLRRQSLFNQWSGPVSARTFSFLASVTVAFAIQAAGTEAQITPDAPVLGRPEAVINLATTEGVQLVKGQWRYSDTRVIEVDHHSPGPDLRPSGPPNKTYDVTPHAEAAEFDDANWEILNADHLDARKPTGRPCFN
jgi:gluconolactonase